MSFIPYIPKTKKSIYFPRLYSQGNLCFSKLYLSKKGFKENDLKFATVLIGQEGTEHENLIAITIHKEKTDQSLKVVNQSAETCEVSLRGVLIYHKLFPVPNVIQLSEATDFKFETIEKKNYMVINLEQVKGKYQSLPPKEEEPTPKDWKKRK